MPWFHYNIDYNGYLIALAGKTLSKQEIYNELRTVLDSELTTKMIDRDLSTLEAENKVFHNKHGEWEFPGIESLSLRNITL